MPFIVFDHRFFYHIAYFSTLIFYYCPIDVCFIFIHRSYPIKPWKLFNKKLDTVIIRTMGFYVLRGFLFWPLSTFHKACTPSSFDPASCYFGFFLSSHRTISSGRSSPAWWRRSRRSPPASRPNSARRRSTARRRYRRSWTSSRRRFVTANYCGSYGSSPPSGFQTLIIGEHSSRTWY